MKKISVYSIIFLSLLFIARFNNPPDGRTGAPGDSSCNSGGCHNTAGANHTANVDISGFPGTLDPGQVYTISLTASHGGTIPANPRLGFQLVVLDENNNNIGTLSNPSPSATLTTSGGRTYAEHNPGLNSSNNTWTVDFTTPMTSPSSMVTVYATANVANGNGNSSGDLIREVTMSANLNAGADPLTATVDKLSDVACNGESTGSAEVTAMGGATMNYEYEWDNGETTKIATSLNAGLHTVTVTDDTEMVVESIIIDEPDPLEVQLVDKTNPTCHNVMDGRIEVVAEGGTPGYTYRWSTGDVGSVLQNVSGGSYTCTVTDDNDCIVLITESLTAPDEITLSFEVENPSCDDSNDGVIRVASEGGVGEIEYFWSTGDEGATLSGIGKGTYMVTATDENNCMTEDMVELTAPDPLTLMWQVQNVSCFGGSDGALGVMVEGGTGGYTYSWSTGSTDPSITGLTPDTYSVTVLDENDCELIADTTIIEPDELIVDAQVDEPDCPCPEGANGSITLDITGGTPPYSVDWSNGVPGSNLTDICEGTYVYTVTDNNDCEVIRAVDVSAPDSITYDLSAEDEMTLMGNDGSAMIGNIMGGTAPYMVEWSTGSTDTMIGPLAPGRYYVTITDTVGCIAIDSVDVEEFDDCTLMATFDSSSPRCFERCDGSITVENVQGVEPITFNWSDNYNEDNPDSLCAGTYSVTFSDAAGCVDSMTFELVDPAPLVITIDSIIPNTGNNNGAIYITITGAVGSISGDLIQNLDIVGTADANQDFLGLEGGFYDVLFLDANGCFASISDIEVPIETSNREEEFANLILYPQPSSTSIIIEGYEGQRIRSITVFNSEVKANHLNFSLEGSVYKADVGDLKEGLHIMQIEFENGQMAFRKLIKQ